MKVGQIVKVTTDCRPQGLVPDKYVKLVYQYSDKWYAFETTERNIAITDIIDSGVITIIHRPKDETKL